MDAQELAAIEARVAEHARRPRWDIDDAAHALLDRAALMAEVRRLQAALDKLDTDLGWFAAGMRDPDG